MAGAPLENEVAPSRKLWLLQNLQFIAQIACKMLSDNRTDWEDPKKML
jgi:hypothetical protein